MEALERVIISKDWTTLLILVIVFLIVVSNFIDQKRLQQLFTIPFDSSYRLNFAHQIWHGFNVLFFVASNLILSLFIYTILQHFYPDTIAFTSRPYMRIVGLLLFYWFFRYSIGKLIAYLFEIKKIHNQITFIKMSYFFSSSLYLLVFLLFYLYFFESRTSYFYVVLGIYLFLLIMRYLQLLSLYKRQIVFHLFYFILYLCALEIAPLLIAIKIGI